MLRKELSSAIHGFLGFEEERGGTKRSLAISRMGSRDPNGMTERTPQRIVVTVLLKKGARDSESVRTLQRNASALGLEPTSQGRATVCFETTPERFQELFAVQAKPRARRKPSDADFGAPAGFEVQAALPIPEELQAQAESISVEPPATRLTDQI